MCGVVGVYGVPGAAIAAHKGTQHLQHRGTEGCGIASIVDGDMVIKKGYCDACITGNYPIPVPE